MTNRNLGLSENTERVLNWAARAQKRDDTVREFWKALCDRFDISTAATGVGVLRLLCKAGSHDVAHIFRGNPVPYSKVCWYIAEKLRPIFDDAGSTKEDLLACEKYVLKKMEISEDDLATLCLAKRDRGARMATNIAAEVENQAVKLVLAGILSAIDIALAELMLLDLADPAYRKAVPGVTYVAILRKLHAVESTFRARAANKPRKRPRMHPGWRLSLAAVG